MQITNSNAGDDQECLEIYQAAVNHGLNINKTDNTENKMTARFSHTGGGANTRYTYIAGKFSGGDNYFFRDLAPAETSGPVVSIVQDNAGDTENALSVQNDGTGNGILIDQNGDAIGLNINNAGTANGLFINQDGAGVALNIDKEGAGVGVNIDQSSAGGDALVITNAGTGEGLQINQTGGASALNINQDGNDYGIYLHCDTTASAFYLYSNADTDAVQIHIGSGSTGNAGIRFYDISDDDDNWALELTTQSPTSPSPGAVWYDGTHIYCRIGGVSKQLDN